MASVFGMYSKLWWLLSLTFLCGVVSGNFPLLDVDTNMRIVLIPYTTPVSSLSFVVFVAFKFLKTGVNKTKFGLKMVFFAIFLQIETRIYRLRASDSDRDFPLKFRVIGTLGESLLDIEFLGCSETEDLCQADVILKKSLDKGRSYEFQLEVKDTMGDFTTVQALITTTDSASSPGYFSHSTVYTLKEVSFFRHRRDGILYSSVIAFTFSRVDKKSIGYCNEIYCF